MNALGRQILVEYYHCNPRVLNDRDRIASAMGEAARLSGATVVEEVFHLFNPHGISGVVVIAESHFSIHTWPEYGYAAVDLFTCGEEIKPEKAFEHLKKILGAEAVSVMELKRGILDSQDKQHPHKPLPAENQAAIIPKRILSQGEAA